MWHPKPTFAQLSERIAPVNTTGCSRMSLKRLHTYQQTSLPAAITRGWVFFDGRVIISNVFSLHVEYSRLLSCQNLYDPLLPSNLPSCHSTTHHHILTSLLLHPAPLLGTFSLLLPPPFNIWLCCILYIPISMSPLLLDLPWLHQFYVKVDPSYVRTTPCNSIFMHVSIYLTSSQL